MNINRVFIVCFCLFLEVQIADQIELSEGSYLVYPKNMIK